MTKVEGASIIVEVLISRSGGPRQGRRTCTTGFETARFPHHLIAVAGSAHQFTYLVLDARSNLLFRPKLT